MRRRLVNFVPALSLLLCVVAVVVAVRSFWIQDRFSRIRFDFQDRTWTQSSQRFWINHGGIGFEHLRREVTFHSDAALSEVLSHPANAPDRLRRTLSGHDAAPAAPPPPRQGSVWAQLGFVASHVRGESPSFKPPPGEAPAFSGIHEQWAYETPLWPAALLLAVTPSLWSVRQWKRAVARRRSRAGQCVRCGYDLRASPSGCPECGAREQSGGRLDRPAAA